MDNPIMNELDKISLMKDIDDRNKIIEQYKQFGILNREDAINKIRELRMKDKDILQVTSASLKISSIPFSQSTNDQIVGELIMQNDILLAKLIEKQSEKKK